jgi:trehalose 6-phosphate synthase/phosphatase
VSPILYKVPESQRLIVVSNRLPLTATHVEGRWRSERSSGGLVAAMAPLMKRYQGLWLGWPGDALPDEPDGRDQLMRQWEEHHGYVAVDLPAQISRAFYEGYANDTLWPLLHGLPTRVAFDPGSWLAYRDANQRFCEAVLERLRPGDLVWVHDYQLMLLPGLIREQVPGAAVGFFLHIPFPASEVFRIVPEREELLRGLLGADAISFQTHADLHDFRRALLQILGLDSQMDRVDVGDRRVQLSALPIGIDPSGWRQLTAPRGEARARIAELREQHRGRKLIISVDRLDYTKGLPERLRTFHRLLQGSPGWRGRVTLVQVAVPSRERVPAYAELRREVAELVGEVNGDFGTPEWQPVVYLHRSVERPELAALYAAADVGWVGPLRDGMNLVAKEFVACQRDGDGILVLSEFAGAAQELGEALRINPYDQVGTAETIERALEMDPAERQDRMAALHARVVRDDAAAWGRRFIEGLRTATGPARQTRRLQRPAPDVARWQREFAAAHHRLVLLDYDGTIVSLTRRPADAAPSAGLVALLGRLASTPDTSVAVITGRARSVIEPWLGGIPGLWLAAEHGALLRGADGAWQPLRSGVDVAWKRRVRPLLTELTASVPGSYIEEKELSIGWHHRPADPEFGAWRANQAVAALEQLLAGTELAVLRGHQVVEVRFAWADKGEVTARLLAGVRRGTTILAMGDDRTDEDMFARLPRRAWTVHVGPGATSARFRVPDPLAAVALLDALTDALRDRYTADA